MNLENNFEGEGAYSSQPTSNQRVLAASVFSGEKHCLTSQPGQPRKRLKKTSTNIVFNVGFFNIGNDSLVALGALAHRRIALASILTIKKGNLASPPAKYKEMGRKCALSEYCRVEGRV